MRMTKHHGFNGCAYKTGGIMTCLGDPTKYRHTCDCPRQLECYLLCEIAVNEEV